MSQKYIETGNVQDRLVKNREKLNNIKDKRTKNREKQKYITDRQAKLERNRTP